jgi:hypothetical protein
MEKRGDVLNQLAIITDMIEKMNLVCSSTTLTIPLSEDEFIRVFNTIQEKYEKKLSIPIDSFSLKIGMVNVIFNMSNV